MYVCSDPKKNKYPLLYRVIVVAWRAGVERLVLMYVSDADKGLPRVAMYVFNLVMPDNHTGLRKCKHTYYLLAAF